MKKIKNTLIITTIVVMFTLFGCNESPIKTFKGHNNNKGKWKIELYNNYCIIYSNIDKNEKVIIHSRSNLKYIRILDNDFKWVTNGSSNPYKNYH